MTKDKTIKCPVCGKGKFVDIDNSKGKNSVACEKCHQFIVIDWDTGTAERGKQIKQAI